LWSHYKTDKIPLRNPRQSTPQVVCISSCGNFAFTGTESGTIMMHNMQSQILRAQFSCRTPIVGLHVTLLNDILIALESHKKISLFDISKHKLLRDIYVPSNISKSIFHKNTSLLAVSSDDYNIRVYDINMKRLVRVFKGHQNIITAMVFTPDGKWLFSSDGDGISNHSGGCNGYILKWKYPSYLSCRL
jgi:U3 small nucleolar RNA-associated protein 21